MILLTIGYISKIKPTILRLPQVLIPIESIKHPPTRQGIGTVIIGNLVLFMLLLCHVHTLHLMLKVNLVLPHGCIPLRILPDHFCFGSWIIVYFVLLVSLGYIMTLFY